jgi:hypothetical protein
MGHRLLRVLAILGVIGLPAMATLLLIYVYLAGSLKHFHPIESDELVHWHSAATFARAGFNGGYYAYNETPAPAGDAVHFGAWGPAYPLALGTLARVIGWRYATPILFNLVAVGLALGLFITLIKPDRRQLAVLSLLLLTFWPIPLYVAGVHQESIHYAFACVLVAGFHLMLTRGDRSLWLKMWVLAVIMIGVFFRLTWGLLLFPYFILALKPTRLPRIVVAIALAATLLMAAVLQYRYLSAPFPYTFSALLHGSLTPWRTLRVLLGLINFNLSSFHQGALLEIAQRYLIVGLGLTMAVRIWRQWRVARHGVTSLVDRVRHVDGDLWLQLFNLGGYFAANLAYAIRPFQDYRILAPHLLFSLLLLILSRRFRILAAVIVLQSLLFLDFLSFFQGWRSQAFAPEADTLEAFRQATEPILEYQEGADPWCNTLLMDDYPYELATLQPGLGFGIILGVDPEELEFPLRSRYLLVAQDTYDSLRDYTSLEFLTSTSAGDLYLNLNADCPSP